MIAYSLVVFFLELFLLFILGSSALIALKNKTGKFDSEDLLLSTPFGASIFLILLYIVSFFYLDGTVAILLLSPFVIYFLFAKRAILTVRNKSWIALGLILVSLWYLILMSFYNCLPEYEYEQIVTINAKLLYLSHNMRFILVPPSFGYPSVMSILVFFSRVLGLDYTSGFQIAFPIMGIFSFSGIALILRRLAERDATSIVLGIVCSLIAVQVPLFGPFAASILPLCIYTSYAYLETGRRQYAIPAFAFTWLTFFFYPTTFVSFIVAAGFSYLLLHFTLKTPIVRIVRYLLYSSMGPVAWYQIYFSAMQPSQAVFDRIQSMIVGFGEAYRGWTVTDYVRLGGSMGILGEAGIGFSTTPVVTCILSLMFLACTFAGFLLYYLMLRFGRGNGLITGYCLTLSLISLLYLGRSIVEDLGFRLSAIKVFSIPGIVLIGHWIIIQSRILYSIKVLSSGLMATVDSKMLTTRRVGLRWATRVLLSIFIAFILLNAFFYFQSYSAPTNLRMAESEAESFLRLNSIVPEREPVGVVAAPVKYYLVTSLLNSPAVLFGNGFSSYFSSSISTEIRYLVKANQPIGLYVDEAYVDAKALEDEWNNFIQQDFVRTLYSDSYLSLCKLDLPRHADAYTLVLSSRYTPAEINQVSEPGTLPIIRIVKHLPNPPYIQDEFNLMRGFYIPENVRRIVFHNLSFYYLSSSDIDMLLEFARTRVLVIDMQSYLALKEMNPDIARLAEYLK